MKFLYQHDGEGPIGFTQGPDGRVYYADIIGNKVGYLEIESLVGEPSADTIGGVVEVTDATHRRQRVSYGDGVRPRRRGGVRDAGQQRSA